MPDPDRETALGERDTLLRTRLADGARGFFARVRDLRTSFQKSPILATAAAFSILAAVYWLLIASDRYVSEADVIVQRTDTGAHAAPDITSILSGDTSGNRHDQLIMREYLLSRGMAAQLDKGLGLSEHYSAWTNDPISKLSFSNSQDEFYEYFLSRVSVEYDEYSGVLIIRSQAYSPQMAQNITAQLVAAGEQFMNKSAQDLSKGQIAYLEEQVANLNRRAISARKDVVNYQNRVGIASPAGEAEAIGSIVAELEARQTQLQTELATKRAFLVDSHPAIVALEQQIAAVNAQIEQENQRLASPQGGRLNAKIEEIERLQARAQFAEDVYRSAITSLEQLRFESTRTIKKLSIIQAPTLPHTAELPERLRQTLVYALLAFLLAGVAQLIAMIIKDHRD